MTTTLSGNEVVGIVVVIAVVICVTVISYLTHASAEHRFVEIRLIPRLRLLPWSAQNRLRRMKLQAEQEEATAAMLSAKFRRVQKELVLMDLEDQRHAKALNPPGTSTTNPNS